MEFTMGKSKSKSKSRGGQCFNFKSVSVSVIFFSVLSFVSVSVPSVRCDDLNLKSNSNSNSTSSIQMLLRLKRQFGFGGGSTSFIGLGIMNELNAGDYIEIDNTLDQVIPPRRSRNRGKRSPEPEPGFKYGYPHYGYHKDWCIGNCHHHHPPPPPPPLKKVIFHHYYHPAPTTSTTPAPFSRMILTDTQQRFQQVNQDYPTAQRLVQSVIQNSRNPQLRNAIVIKEEGVRCEDVCSVPGNVTYGLLGICTENYCRCNSNAGSGRGFNGGIGSLNPPAPLGYSQEICPGNEVFDPLKLECDLPYNTLLCSDLRPEPTEAPKPEIHIKYVPVYYPVHYKQILKVEPAVQVPVAVVKQVQPVVQLVESSPVAVQPAQLYLPPVQPQSEYLPPAQPAHEYLPPVQHQGQGQQIFLQKIQPQQQPQQQLLVQSPTGTGQELFENHGTQIQHPAGVSQVQISQTRSSGNGNGITSVQSQQIPAPAPVQLVQVHSQIQEQPQEQQQQQLLFFSNQNQVIDSAPVEVVQITSDNKKKRRRRVRVKKGHRRVKAVQQEEQQQVQEEKESGNFGEKTAQS